MDQDILRDIMLSIRPMWDLTLPPRTVPNARGESQNRGMNHPRLS